MPLMEIVSILMYWNAWIRCVSSNKSNPSCPVQEDAPYPRQLNDEPFELLACQKRSKSLDYPPLSVRDFTFKLAHFIWFHITGVRVNREQRAVLMIS